ncbi:nucleotidyltransferase family protein [Geoalkalibacter sp.]|jgi:predicted nucleotidyltransferase|uniref:nucleotidyltransferase family protein n=1 Tax=Geoalkalibacter sp. TaxID=3041440 RepID=UPI00272E4E6C|nr:nucleotidyltransferase family protein [Geoalkalibacter sp.]
MAKMHDILDFLREVQPCLRQDYKVNEIGLFGSVVRGEDKETSDIDILVDLDESADLLDLIGLSQFLEEKLHQPVDVVPKSSLRREIREKVIQEVRYP